MARFWLAVAMAGGIGWTAESAEGLVTFHRDVLPILARNCQGCHRPGQLAPMSFLTFAPTRPRAPPLKAVALRKKMPPAVSNPHYPVLTREDGLIRTEIEILVKWVDGGAAEGTPERR